ncbi:hypothetical protein AGLY_012167 [Aphis glycines]|uniref:Tesmin/TSO1-like CXC domain-containing protein n=1 Tax=Aphis glycines TaxID=307491 RepID=A0A6G0TA80_APHGL|nr:hypothetical protein AGLY_012167 [Aphis glycines]
MVWHQNETYEAICAAYINYKQRKNNGATKTSSPDINFKDTMICTVSQENLLSNRNNKIRLISMLSVKFRLNNFIVKQATDNADVLIIKTAINEAMNNITTVVGDDVDLFVILTAHSLATQEIFFLKPNKKNVEKKLYSSRSFDQHLIRDQILFLHAFSVCDTTSALSHKGKSSALKLMTKREYLRLATQIFNSQNVLREKLIENGIKFMLGIYGAPIDETSLNEYRYSSFIKSVSKDEPVKLNLLPPTTDVAEMHLLCVNYQVLKWLGNDLNPTDWGWILREGVLMPRRMLQLPAPDCLLNMIFCKCVKGCGALCSCRKLGLDCSAVCANCHGQSCYNSPPLESTVEENDNSNNTYINPNDVMEQAAEEIETSENIYYSDGYEMEEEEKI